MAYERKANSGALFKNDKRETDSHPLYKGSALIDGNEYWLDCWLNKANSGEQYMSLKFKRKDADQRGSYGKQEPMSKRAHSDDDDPFSDSVPF